MSSFPSVGDQFGPFQITGLIGQSGPGTVFAAQQASPSRPVALKVFNQQLSDDADFAARFTREAQTLASVDSPHLVKAYGHGLINGFLYLATQLVPGVSLSAYLAQNGPLPLAQAADLLAQVGSALAEAHAHHIIHGDIGPADVLIVQTGREPFAYLGDFGITQGWRADAAHADQFASGITFPPPERQEGGPADERGDIYALGGLFWEMLRAPDTSSGTDSRKSSQHSSSTIPQLPGSDPTTTAANSLLARLLATNPQDRPATAAEVVQLARDVHGQPAASSTDESVTRPLLGGSVVPEITNPTPHVSPPSASLPPLPPLPPTKPVTRGATSPATPPSKTRLRPAILVVGVVAGVVVLGVSGTFVYSNTTSANRPPTTLTTPAAGPATMPTAATASSAAPTTPPAGRSAASELSTSVEVGSNPHGIAIAPGSRLAFIANYGEGSVSVVDIDSNAVVELIEVGANPQSVALDPTLGLLMVGCDGVPAVQIYDLQTYDFVGSVDTGPGPIRIAVNSSKHLAYVVAQGSSTLDVISLNTYAVTQTIEIGARPRVVAIDEQDDIAYVGHWDSHTVSVIDLNAKRKVAEINVGTDPNTIAILEDTRFAFVGNYADGKPGKGTVSVINLNTRSVQKTIHVDTGPSRLVADQEANVVYLSCLGASTVDVISVESLTVTDQLKTANRPTGVAIDSSTGNLYLTSFGANVVQVFTS